jgi:uncharacterized membrane protein
MTNSVRSEWRGRSLDQRSWPGKDMALILLGAGVLALTILAGEFLTLPAIVSWSLALVRVALGLAYVLYVPGYCLAGALFPGADDLDGLERTGLSLGLSVTWASALALILDRLPWGLSLGSMLGGLLASIAAFAAVAVWRRRRLPAGAAFAPALAWRPGPWWRARPPLDRRVLLACAGALLVAGLSAAWVAFVPSPADFMTELYILGREGLAEDYPRQATAGESLSVTLGIANREREVMTYRVAVWAVDPWGGRRELVNAAGPFVLSPGETIEQPLAWQMPWPGDDLVVEFHLFAGGQDGAEPYRSLRLWLDVAE